MNIIEKLGITPGPWEIERRDDDYDLIESVGNIEPGFTHADDAWVDISEKDALLVSAAPEMLKALIAIGTSKIYASIYEQNGFSDACKKGVQAIEKATEKTWQEIKELNEEAEIDNS